MASPRQGPPAPNRSQPGPFTAKKTTAPPPPPPPPPPAATGSTSEGAAFNKFINAHPTMRQYADAIWNWANVYGVDKVTAAALFWRESFAAAKASGQDPATIESPTKQGVGIGQINPIHVGGAAPWGTLTQSDLTNPQRNIQWSMWFFSQQIQKYGTADAAYNQGYNPGYNGPPLSSLLPKGYVPRGGLNPVEKGQVSAAQSAATSAAKTQLFDRWVVLGADGKLKMVKITDPSTPPKNVLKYGPTPLTQTTFNQVWKQSYQDTFFAYTGHAATGKQVAAILKNAPSIYTLSTTLAAQPGFTKSPTYKAHAPGIIAIAKQMFGQNWKVDSKLVSNAIAQNWDQATLTANLKARPEYVNGPEFQDSKAKMSNVYSTIYGTPGPEQNSLLQAVTKQGWAPDQFALWLRQQPEYKQSEEFKSRIFGLGQQLGLITGTPATLTAAQAELGAGPAAPSFQQAPPPPPPAPPVTNPPRGEAKNQPPFTRKAA